MTYLTHYPQGPYQPTFVPARTAAAMLDLLILWMLGDAIDPGLLMGLLDPAIALIPLVASVSLITQGLANIAWRNGVVSPIGVSGLLCAVSGAGKTLALRLLADPIHAAVQARIREGIPGGRTPQFFIEDSTREAVIVQLSEWAVAGLLTDEALQIASLVRHGAGTLAKLIDGSPLPHARVSNGGRRIALHDHRFTMLVMGQPSVIEGSKGLLGPSTGSVGLFNRFFCGRAEISPGRSAAPNLELSAATKARWNGRAEERIRQTIDLVLSGKPRPTLHLSASGLRRFEGVADEATAARTDRRLVNADEYVSRHSERVLRFAGALHVLRHGPTGEVEADTVEAAHQIGLWSIEGHAALLYEPPKVTQTESDAAHMEQVLLQMAHRHGPHFKLSELRRMCPNFAMTRARFDRALPLLAGAGKVSVYMYGRDDWLFLHLPPAPWLSFDSR